RRSGKEYRLLVRSRSGGGPPQSKTSRRFVQSADSRSVLDCGGPPPLRSSEQDQTRTPPARRDCDQSFVTQPLPGMYSRLPDDDLHPAATTSAASSNRRQSFFIRQF